MTTIKLDLYFMNVINNKNLVKKVHNSVKILQMISKFKLGLFYNASHLHTCLGERGSSKSAHAWIWVIFCMLNTYFITTTKTKLFYSSKAVRPQGGTLMYILFVLIYGLLNISLKSLPLSTATFFEWNMKEDSPVYTLLPLMHMNTSR